MNNSNLVYFFIVVLPRLSLGFFLFCILVGMYLYPGSTYHNYETVGYLFSENFLSDLGRTMTYKGENNFHTSILFNMALCFGGVTYTVFYFMIKNLFDNKLITNLGSLFGICGALCFIGVALTPADLFLDSHIFFNTWLFRCFLLSTLFYSWLIYKSPKISNYYLLGNLIFIVSLIIYILILMYAPSPKVSYEALVFQAVTQKFILFNFVGSIIVQTYGYSKIIDL